MDLTHAAMAGDRAAFGQLVARHQASVRALARRLARSASDGDDIAQSAFLTAWRRRSTWRGGSFRGWVCVIAYREFLATRKGVRTETSDEDQPGADGETGERLDLTRAMADGEVLKMSITATNSDDKAITADIHTTVKVESVQSDKEGTYLQAGGILFEMSDVKKIVTAPTTTTTTTA